MLSPTPESAHLRFCCKKSSQIYSGVIVNFIFLPFLLKACPLICAHNFPLISPVPCHARLRLPVAVLRQPQLFLPPKFNVLTVASVRWPQSHLHNQTEPPIFRPPLRNLRMATKQPYRRPVMSTDLPSPTPCRRSGLGIILPNLIALHHVDLAKLNCLIHAHAPWPAS